MIRNAKILVPAIAALSLSACVSFGGNAPAQLLTLTSDARVATGTVRTGAPGTSITVMDPDTPKKLDTVRVPVQVDAVSVAYIKDAQWVDSPRHLFQKMLSETIAASGTAIVLDSGQYSSDPGKRLLGELIDFGVDARTNTAVVTYDATLVGHVFRQAGRTHDTLELCAHLLAAHAIEPPPASQRRHQPRCGLRVEGVERDDQIRDHPIACTIALMETPLVRRERTI